MQITSVFDACCGWCCGFAPTLHAFAEQHVGSTTKGLVAALDRQLAAVAN